MSQYQEKFKAPQKTWLTASSQHRECKYWVFSANAVHTTRQSQALQKQMRMARSYKIENIIFTSGRFTFLLQTSIPLEMTCTDRGQRSSNLRLQDDQSTDELNQPIEEKNAGHANTTHAAELRQQKNYTLQIRQDNYSTILCQITA